MSIRETSSFARSFGSIRLSDAEQWARDKFAETNKLVEDAGNSAIIPVSSQEYIHGKLSPILEGEMTVRQAEILMQAIAELHII